ncbi:MAG: SDR family NAD(P)-dependent oxidoreductase [Marinosulfonomonas sp.]
MHAKTILITGCSSGIGYDAAKTLDARGWRVFATCRAEQDCDTLNAEGLESFQLDYADESSVEAAVKETLKRTGGTLDAVFNNGAFAIPCALEDLPRDALRSIFETNLFGYHDLMRQVLPVMRNQGHGRIVNCSSVLGLVGAKWRGAYVATKFALEGLSDTYRLELRGSGVDMILIEPGPITSKFRENALANLNRWIDWENSPLVEDYRKSIAERTRKDRGPDPFELPASAVTQKLIKALEAPAPKPRYYVTKPTYAIGALKRILSTSQLDWVISKGQK